MKKEFNGLIHSAKEAETTGEFASALQLYKSALCLFPDHAKLLNKVEKLVEKVNYLNTLDTVDGEWKQDPKTGDVLLDAGMSTEFTVTKDIFDKLYPHQREGVSWMWTLFKKNTGGILGDDMGLGKTIQVASFLHGLFHSRLIDTALLIMPLSLMSNWETELSRWCPRKRVRLFHGTSTNRERALDEILQKSGIILTTYETAQSAFKSLSMRGEEVLKWDLIILDEGHKIKDPTKKTSKAISTFQARSKFVLSGTPILNNLQELWALLNYTCDGQLLGEIKTFKREFEEPIVRGQLKGASDYEVKKGAAVTQKLRDLIAPHFIRRMKTDIISSSSSDPSTSTPSASSALESPSTSSPNNVTSNSPSSTSSSSKVPQKVGDKTLSNSLEISLASPENSFNSSLKHPHSPSSAASRFDKTVSSSKLSSLPSDDGLGDELALSLGAVSIHSPVKLSSSSSKRGAAIPDLTVKKNDLVCWIPIEPLQLAIYTQFLVSQRDRISEAIASTGQALPAIRVLRQITNHPRLVRSQEASDSLAFPGFNLPELSTSQRCVEQSGKLRFLVDLLRQLKRNDHRVLIFSQSVKMLDLIEKCFDEEKTGWRRLRMDGSVNKVSERKALVDEYNTNREIFLFLMTTQVGGVGITLTSADRVVIFDPAWNTAMDDQAADRAYRIGQKRNVVIYRLISSGTIEEKMYRKQVFKGALSKSLLGKEASVHTYFTRGELRELFTFDPADVKEAQTQGLLAALHSHKRDSYPELDREMEFLQKLPTVVGISDHNLLYTEETQRLQREHETDTLATQAHELLMKTIVPKDVVQSEQEESSRKMAARGKRGPITTIYVDEDGNSLRPRKDPSQVGTRVGDITLLTVDDQFELGLANMKVSQAKVRKNPFSVREKPRIGNLGGNDHIQRLPTVAKKVSSPTSSSTASTTSSKTRADAKPKTSSATGLPAVVSSKKTQVLFPPMSFVQIPSVKRAEVKKEPTTAPTVTIKKAASVLPSTVSDSNPAQKVSLNSPEKRVSAHEEDVEEEIARLLNEVTIRRVKPVASSAVPATTINTTTVATPTPSTVLKPRNRRTIVEDDDDEFVAPVVEKSESSPVLSSVADKLQSTPIDIDGDGDDDDDDDDDEEDMEEVIPRAIVLPKMSRKSIISFDVSPDENINEQIVIDASAYEEDDSKFVRPVDEAEGVPLEKVDFSEKHEVGTEGDLTESGDDEEGDDEGSSDGEEECSEASESEFTISAAESDVGHAGGLSKHFLSANDLKREEDEEEEEKTAKWIGNRDEDDIETSSDGDGDDEVDSHPSFIASSDDEQEAEEAVGEVEHEDDEVVDFDEHDDVVRRILQKKANVEASVVSESMGSNPTLADETIRDTAAIRLYSADATTAQPPSSSSSSSLSSSSLSSSSAKKPVLSYTQPRPRRRIIESDEED